MNKEKLDSFIEELIYNSEIPNTNTVDINYVIDRLVEIRYTKKELKKIKRGIF